MRHFVGGEVMAVPDPVRHGFGKGIHRVPSLIEVRPLGVPNATSIVTKTSGDDSFKWERSRSENGAKCATSRSQPNLCDFECKARRKVQARSSLKHNAILPCPQRSGGRTSLSVGQ